MRYDYEFCYIRCYINFHLIVLRLCKFSIYNSNISPGLSEHIQYIW